MIVKLGNVDNEVISATDLEHRWLNDYLSFESKSAQYTSAVRVGSWDGKTRVYSLLTKRFPAGLLPLVQRGAGKVGLTVEVLGAPARVQAGSFVAAWLDARRDQPAALAACLSSQGQGRGIVEAPTGGGKTEVIVALAATVPCRWLVLVPGIDLLAQTCERFETRLGEQPGRVGDGLWEVGAGPIGGRVVVATFQTLFAGIRRKDRRVMALLQNTEAVSFDEVHLLASASFLTVSRRLVNAAWRFGFSGTPLARGDQRTVYLVGATGPVIYKIKPQVLIDNGVLSAPKIQFVPCIQRVNGFSWPDVYKGGISESAARNALLTQMVLKAEKPALLFIKEIAHGRAMLAKLRTAGLKADFVHGVKSSAERKQANKRLVHGDIDVLIASTIYDQGVDIPELRSIIIGCGGKSDIKSLQRLGRGMRIAEGKTEMELWDVLDQGNPWLENHAKQRRGIYISQGYQIVELATSFAA